MEVSSPGLERELIKDTHFLAVLGEKVKLRLIRPKDSRRDIRGILEAYENGMITIRLGDGSGLCINKKEAGYVKLDDFYNFGGIEK